MACWPDATAMEVDASAPGLPTAGLALAPWLPAPHLGGGVASPQRGLLCLPLWQGNSLQPFTRRLWEGTRRCFALYRGVGFIVRLVAAGKALPAPGMWLVSAGRL